MRDGCLYVMTFRVECTPYTLSLTNSEDWFREYFELHLLFEGQMMVQLRVSCCRCKFDDETSATSSAAFGSIASIEEGTTKHRHESL